MSSPNQRPPWGRALIALLVVLFGVALWRTAWLSDDCFITLRSVDNFVHGYGLRWNVAERVQVYTHPLWMFALSACRLLGGEYYYSVLSLCAALCFGVLWILVRHLASSYQGAALGLLLLLFSMAFVDFSTSGLEAPLTHLLIAVFAWLWFRESRTEPSLTALALVAALAACNRMDTLLLFGPALCLAAWRVGFWPALRQGFLGMSPFLAWLAFSTFYYGTPFPNTAYAKAFCPGIPANELAIQGLYYLLDSLQRDPLSLATICLALGLGLVERKLERLLWLLGACLYLAYVVKVGGDFMSGRFLTPPFLMAVIALVQSDLWQRRSSFAVLLGAAAVLMSSLFSQPALWSPADFGAAALNEHGIVNERGFYYQGLGLRSSARRSLQPGQGSRALQAAGRQDTPVGVRNFIGLEGLHAGPQVHIVDKLLCDPLLVRLPIYELGEWRVGHYARRVPEGYLETLRSGVNRIRHPQLAEYYAELRLITRGRLWDSARLAAIYRQLTGANAHLIQRFVEEAYFEPQLVRRDASFLPEQRPAVDDWSSPEAQVLYQAGIELNFREPQQGQRLVLGMHNGDLMRVRFFLGKEALGQVDFESPGSFAQEMLEVMRPVPAKARAGFDRLLLLPRESYDSVLAIAWLRVE